MANRATLSNYEYTAFGKETTHGVFVDPTHFSKNTQIDIGYDGSYQNIEQIDQTFFQGATIKDKISTGGKLSGYANAEDSGYILSMALGTPTTSTVTTGVYSHLYNLGDKAAQTYTVEVSKGGYVERVSGVCLDKVTLNSDGAAIKFDGDSKGEKCFSFGSLTANATLGTGVTITLDDTNGLIAGDTLVFASDAEEVVIISVATSTTVTANLVANKTSGDTVTLKKKTASFTTEQLEPLKWYGKASVKFADTMGGLSAASQTVIQNVNIDIMNNLQDDYGSGSYYNQDLIQGLRNGNGKISLTMAQGQALQYKFIKDSFQYIEFTTEGNKIGATAYYQKLTFKAKIKFTKSPVNLSSGEIIKLNMDFKIVDEGTLTLQNGVTAY